MTNIIYNRDKNAPVDHPEIIMKHLGITYNVSMQFFPDLWVFRDCENIPHKLPTYLQETESVPLNISMDI